MNESIFTIILLGDSNAGKIELINKFTHNIYGEANNAEFILKKIEINGQKIMLYIWDSPGIEKFFHISYSFVKGADGIIFIFDITNKKSFEKIRDWLMTSEETFQDFSKILVGNKFNLDERKVDKETAEKFSQKYNMKYFEANSKDGTNVELIFKELAKTTI